MNPTPPTSLSAGLPKTPQRFLRLASGMATSLLLCTAALAKIPAPLLSDEAKAKAAEVAAKTAWTGKVDAFQLCRSQDKAAAAYFSAAKAKGVEAKPATAVAPCADPGAFAYAPPEAKPLEAAGAHSPAATATSPSSTTKPAADTPAKKS